MNKMQLIFLIVIFIFLWPALVYAVAFYRNNFSEAYLKAKLNYDTELSGFERLANLKFEQSDHPTVGCEHGLYLGTIDKWQDCQIKCGGYDYEYRYVHPSDNIRINDRKLNGAYCLPKPVAKCNLNTSIATIGLDGYKCLSMFPQLLGGPSGNEIIGCRSRKLIDRQTKEIYENYVPPNLVMSDVNEKYNGEYRFECVIDDDQFHLPPDYGSRFETELNVCGLLDENKGRFDFENKKCKCDNYVGENENQLCTDCTSGWTVSTPNNAHGTNYGYTIGRDCVDPTMASSELTQFIKMPCGHTTLQAAATPEAMDAPQAKVTHCERALLYATNTYTPPALENMFG